MLKKVEIFTDFDGTITDNDCLEYLLNKFANTSWLEIEERVLKGSLSEIEALQSEFDLINANADEAVQTLVNDISIDRSFRDFSDWAERKNCGLTVLSGGFTEFIEAIFKRDGISELNIIANSFRIENGRWIIMKAPVKRLCDQCNHCKTASIINASAQNSFTIYIGDGTTDRCAALFSNFVFAKGTLLEFCVKHNIPHRKLNGFSSLPREIESILNETELYSPLYGFNTDTFPPLEVKTMTSL